MTRDFPYVQLPGTFRGFFRKASLWEGVDHILSVSGTRFNDEYRRFYYRDIQAFIVEKRPQAGSWGWWILLLLALIFAGGAAFGNSSALNWSIFAALFIVLLVRLEFTFRRSCRCLVQTAVSREYLPSLMRRTDTDKVIQRLQTRIAALQGELPPEIPSSTNDAAGFVLPPDPGLKSPEEMLQETAIRASREAAVRGVNFAIVTLFVLLFNAVFTFYVSSGNRLSFQVSSTILGYLFVALSLIPALLSLQNLAGLKACKGVRLLMVGVIVFGVLRFAVSLVFSRSLNFFPIFNRYYANTNGGIQLAFAAGGLILIFAKWEQYRRGEESSH